MKKILVLSLILLSYLTATAQKATTTYLWPIKDQKAGTGILYKPQSYISGEHNFGDMFITAHEGTVIVAPCDGTIQYIGISYRHSLVQMSMFGFDTKMSPNEVIQKGVPELDKKLHPKSVNVYISILADDGNQVSVFGFLTDEIFKTGQRIKQGTPLGIIGHSYYKIEEPSVNISISKYGKVADPMTPFGLQTTFIPPEEIKPITSLTVEQAKEDFMIYINSLKEAYPGLYKVVSAEELEEYVAKTIADIESSGEEISYDKFRYYMRLTVAKIHDSHIGMHPTLWNKPGTRPSYQPQLWLGFFDNKLICTNATKDYEHLIGKEIISANGMSADSIKQSIYEHASGYDAKVEQYKDYDAAFMGFGILLSGEYDLNVELADGGVVEAKGYSTKLGLRPLVNNILDFVNTNIYPKDLKKTAMLNDSTAFLGISTFELNEVQLEEIAAFIDSISDVEHLIIDVRHNDGGNVESLMQIYSYIAGEPIELDGYMRMNKKGAFDSFKYSLNYFGTTNDLLPESEMIEPLAEPGVYYRNPHNTIVPDSVVNYKGKVYMLTDENSISAATLLPSMLVRNHRGVVVGRETRTAYHFMSAMKFMDLQLPNSKITITIPLVESVFDTVVNDRVPYGRGLLPDYYVPLTLDEMISKNGDAILNHAMELIANGEYITGENPFIQPEEEKSKLGKYIIPATLFITLVIVFLLLSVRKRAQKKAS